ncbi:MAG TPA: class 1 isoprenoid biosynthesis enzyme [Chitinophaga sp.]
MQRTNKVGLLKTIRCLSSLRWQLQKQAQYIKTHLPPLLDTLAAGREEQFTTRTVKRITKYWELSLHVICNSLYKLTGKDLSTAEHKRILLLSIFGPLYDDLFDDRILTHEQIASFTLEPAKHIPASFEEHVVKKIYLELLELSPRPEKITEHLYEVFIWQKASLKQLTPDVSQEELFEITYKKSYYSILLFYSILDHYPDEAVLEMTYPMAGLLQLTNDAFDVYKDVHSGIYTIPNLYRNFDQLQQHFMNEVALFNQRLMQLPFVQQAKDIYGITIHALHAMGWMAMEQLKETTRDVNSVEELTTLSRQSLVCDMDHFSQKLKWIRQVNYLVNHRTG